MAAAYANFFRLWKAEAARNSVAPQRLVFQQPSAPSKLLQSTDSGMSPSQQIPAVVDTLGTSQTSTSNVGTSSSDIVGLDRGVNKTAFHSLLSFLLLPLLLPLTNLPRPPNPK
ncbi:hypothetical protein Pmani_022944 [Petrolisthes manimaculis]|uniref:Uncharacterized protein n=1 Tax=Petrolisthes manimaculis TaxID=1843537 RepID=A0AAE1PAZ6_9EUCA|nr:hypothetical protein Pmani_022944 [Petrolisthes manimaculis]